MAVLTLGAPVTPATASCLVIPTHEEMERQMDELTARVRDDPDDRTAWIHLFSFLTHRADNELADARLQTLERWELDPRLERPDEVRAVYGAVRDEWKRRYLERLPTEEQGSCELRRRLREEQPAEEILALPLPERVSEVECRTYRLWTAGRHEDARRLALRFRDADPSVPERHGPLIDILWRLESGTGDKQPWLEALEYLVSSVPDDAESRRRLLAAYRQQGFEVRADALFTELWNEAGSDDERLAVCHAFESGNEDVACFRDLFALAGEGSAAGRWALDEIYKMTVHADVANALPAWLELASPETAFESWHWILPHPDACLLFLERVERGDYDHLGPSESDPDHPAGQIARWLGQCKLPDAEAAWRRRARDRWGQEALVRSEPQPPPDFRTWAEQWADVGIEALEAGDATTAARIGQAIFEAPCELSHRERSAGRYLLGRAAVLDERWADAAGLLEPFYLDLVRFSGPRDLSPLDGPFRRLLAGLGEENLARYHARSLEADAFYRRYLGADPGREETAASGHSTPWTSCDSLRCSDSYPAVFRDQDTLRVGRSVR